jgi:hypothetical protein
LGYIELFHDEIFLKSNLRLSLLAKHRQPVLKLLPTTNWQKNIMTRDGIVRRIK